MTKEERAMLREAAEKAAKAPATQFACLPHKAIANFGRAANPATILSLLDALDGAERDAERYRRIKAGDVTVMIHHGFDDDEYPEIAELDASIDSILEEDARHA